MTSCNIKMSTVMLSTSARTKTTTHIRETQVRFIIKIGTKLYVDYTSAAISSLVKQIHTVRT